MKLTNADFAACRDRTNPDRAQFAYLLATTYAATEVARAVRRTNAECRAATELYRAHAAAIASRDEWLMAIAEAALTEFRADDVLRASIAPAALVALRTPHERIELAVLGYFYDHDNTWPRLTDLATYTRRQFGWTNAGQRIERTINEPDETTAGVWLAREEWIDLVDDEFTFPDDRVRDFRCYVSAEAQVKHRLHEVWNTFAYETQMPDEVTR